MAKCEYCGAEIVGRNFRAKYCSDKCRFRKNNKTSKEAAKINCTIQRKCVVCNRYFYPRQWNSKFCSKECRWKKYSQQDKNKQYRRDYQKTHRRRYTEIMVDSDISLFKLSNRDGNQCKICGLFVDWTDSPQGDMYPSIDHIKPISLGGLHSWDNVQLTHRRCNYMKSNKYIG